MRVINRFETYGKKMVIVIVGSNVSVMTQNDYDWICNKEKKYGVQIIGHLM